MNGRMGRRSFIRAAGSVAAGAAVLSGRALGAAEAGKTVVLAFAGVAHIHTPSFINLLKKREDVTVKSVYDHDAARAAQRARDLGAKAVDTPDAIFNDPEVQGVVITSETNRHPELVLGAAKAKKHMFAEKPLGITAKESYEMAAAIEQAGVLFTTGYFMRTDPKHIFLKDQIAKGAFGIVTRVRGSNCHSGSLGGWFDTEWRWMADPKIAGVGAFGDLGTHSLDIMMWLLGDVAGATAEIMTVTGRYGKETDETGEGLMKFQAGPVGTLAAGWVDVANPVTLVVSGTEGHAAIINDQLFITGKKIEGADGKTPYTRLPEAPPAPMHQFVNAIKGQPMPLVAPLEAAKRVAVMEAMYQGARDHKWVQVMNK
jgi:predicted dehydrogenase